MSQRRLVNALWITSAAILLMGFGSSALAVAEGSAVLRWTGIVLIAVGVAFALLAWIGEGVASRGSH